MTNRRTFSDLLFHARILTSRMTHSAFFSAGKHGLHTARFAYPHELLPLYLFHKSPATRLPIGRGYAGRVLGLTPTHKRPELGNMAYFAPTRGGKGLDAVCKILTWPHSLIINDIKGEFYRQTAGYRSQIGEVYVLDPTGVGHRYDPYQGRMKTLDIQKIAVSLLHGNIDGENGIFLDRARKMQEAMAKSADLEGYPVFPYMRSLFSGGLDAAVARLAAVDPALAVKFLTVNPETANVSDRFLLHTWATLDTKLAPLMSETVVAMLSASDFHAKDLLFGAPKTVYLRWPERYLLNLAPLVRLLFHSFIDELLSTHDALAGKECQPVILLIDEAGRTAIPSLAEHATTVVGRNIILCMYFQSLSQLEAIYGQTAASIILDNTDTQIFLRPNRNPRTNKTIEENLGLKSEYASSVHLREGEETSEGKSEQAIPLIPAYAISQMDDTDIIGFYRNLPRRSTPSRSPPRPQPGAKGRGGADHLDILAGRLSASALRGGEAPSEASGLTRGISLTFSDAAISRHPL
jgi:type IV secretion system protein VirD4